MSLRAPLLFLPTLALLGLAACTTPDSSRSESRIPEEFAAAAASYAEHCSACHGKQLAGTWVGPPLVGEDAGAAKSLSELTGSIATGRVEKKMPAWKGVLSDEEIRQLALFILERRGGGPASRAQ